MVSRAIQTAQLLIFWGKIANLTNRNQNRLVELLCNFSALKKSSTAYANKNRIIHKTINGLSS